MTDRQTDRLADMQTDRQTDRQLVYLVGVLEVKGVDDVVAMTPFTYKPLLRTELEGGRRGGGGGGG